VAAELRVGDAGLVWYLQGMGSSGLKQKIVETVEHLPDDATVEDAMERLYFLAKIERGLAESEAGDTISHEDVKKRFLG
jgi:predicted transcriptional regulator